MKLTYWVCVHKEDHSAYSIRAKTRKSAELQREAYGAERFRKAVKVEVIYADAFDLVTQALGEGSLNEPGAYDDEDEAA